MQLFLYGCSRTAHTVVMASTRGLKFQAAGFSGNERTEFELVFDPTWNYQKDKGIMKFPVWLRELGLDSLRDNKEC
jgi:hypothetical protein